MLKKNGIINLKSVFMNLFVMVFIFGGFFLSTSSVKAMEGTRTVFTSYTLSAVVSNPNSEGGVTTKVMVGCAVGSGDLYDINTGKPCVSFTKKVLIGCAVGSGDLYDINTGKPCKNTKPVVIVGCKAMSGDIYDITTGKLCTNNTKKEVEVPVKKLPVVAIQNKVESKEVNEKVNENILTQAIKNDEIINSNDNVSGREKIKDSILATTEKAASVIKGPMAIWIIILIVIIILGGYGVYSILKKDEEVPIAVTPIKATPTPVVSAPVINTPIINSTQTTIPLPVKEEVKDSTMNISK